MLASTRLICLASLLAGSLSVSGIAATIPAVPTSTLLSTDVSGSFISKIAHGTAITLTVQVHSPTATVTRGQVQFCDGAAPHCTGLGLLATAQITPAGIATFKLIPGIGTHTYRAQFLGVLTAYQPSNSSTETLTVTGKFPTTTSLEVSGSNGTYTFTSTVTTFGTTVAPQGFTFFSDLDQPTSSQDLGSAIFGPATSGLQFKLLTQLYSVGAPIPNTAADFNGDGNLDIVDRGLYLGSGNGTFTASTANVPDACPTIADFNSDGFLDFACVNGSGNLDFVAGNGNGTFNAPVTQTLPPNVGSLATADFNGDGIPDLAGVTADSGKGSKIILLYGLGSGTFTEATIALPAPSGNIVTGDFNGDGIPDLAVVQDLGVYVLFGNGHGHFPTNLLIPVAEDPSQIVVGDFNNDGADDFATLSYEEGALISIALTNGEGGFNPAQYYGATNIINGLAVTDLNRDGNADLVFSGQFTGINDIGEFGVLFGNGNGVFTTNYFPINNRLFAGQSSGSILIGDFNNDGNPDVIAGSAILLDQPTETMQDTLANVTLAPGSHAIEGETLFINLTTNQHEPFTTSLSPLTDIVVPQ